METYFDCISDSSSFITLMVYRNEVQLLDVSPFCVYFFWSFFTQLPRFETRVCCIYVYDKVLVLQLINGYVVFDVGIVFLFIILI